MNIIELAQECQLIGMRPHLDGIYIEALEKFAALVEAAARADEREACIKVCMESKVQAMDFFGSAYVGGHFADAIKQRRTT